MMWTFLLAALLATPAAFAESRDETLWHHRNLGKAFYENPATQYEAVDEFKKALDLAPDSARERVNYGLALLRAGKVGEGIAELEKAQEQDPSIPHTWFNLGIAYKRDSRYDDAIAQLEGMVRLVPEEAISHYNLGVLYKLERDRAKAVAHFETAAKLDPRLAGPHFQLAAAYRQAKRAEDAKREMALFREIKKRDAGAAVPEDLEWSYYAEIYETLDPASDRDSGEPAPLRFEARAVAGGLEPETAGLAVTDADGDGRADLLAWSAAGARLLRGGTEKTASGLEALKGVVAIAPGDFDDDGLADLCVLTRSGASLYRNAGGRYAAHPAALPAGAYRAAVWLDYEHDYDVDLFLLGDRSALVRNQGDGGFVDRTADFPFVDGRAVAGTRVDVVADTQGMDLAVAYADHGGVVYRDRLGGRYEPWLVPFLRAGATAVVAHDVDRDGWTDLTAAGDTSATLLINARDGSFERRDAPQGARAPILWADFENRAAVDLAAGGQVYRGLGADRYADGTVPEGWPAATRAAVAADFDGDGRVDAAAVDGEGNVVVLANRTRGDHRWLRVALAGKKNLKLSPGAEVEVKAGSRYQKKTYDGTPLHFGLGPRERVDTVRVTWPNGLIQNETLQPAGALEVEEAQRLSGSCPMIYTWNGEEFEFITDVLGVAPLGASAGDGEYFPVDHDEVVQIAGSSLVAADGAYEIRVVEELREVAYLDEVRLIAVDHPAEVEVFTNDKFKGPPFPEFRLYGIKRRVRPLAARDHRGRDVLERVLARDRAYPDGFERDFAGVAEMHHLELDFGRAAAEGRAVLVLSGWVDWADGSTFLGASQGAGGGLVMPYLQVKDAEGRWRTVIEDVGIPAGKPKTIVVDLTGKFLSDSREVRIVTNLCVYWDEVFLSEETGEPETRLTDLHAMDARLRFRGFSKVVIHPERRQPERFVYAERRPLAMWNPTPGLYTRYGDVAALLASIDDRLVVMGSGDELRLRFDARALPELLPGWRRDFLLFVDGWAKDGDANTAHSQTVGPLPYHGMPQYPYAPPHRFPDDAVHDVYREHYNTRPALRLIRPLTEGLDAKKR